MEHVHYLHSQHYHYATRSRKGLLPELQIFAAIDRVLQHTIDRVLVHAGAFGDDLSHFATHLAQKNRGTKGFRL